MQPSQPSHFKLLLLLLLAAQRLSSSLQTASPIRRRRRLGFHQREAAVTRHTSRIPHCVDHGRIAYKSR